MSENVATNEKTTEDLIREFYQGEVFGEAFLFEMMKRFTSPSEQYKLGTLLQFETETKSRIRPVAAAYGVNLMELQESRKGGVDAADSVPIEDWDELMKALVTPSEESYKQYKEMTAQLPQELASFSEMMNEHEHAIHIFFAKEASGEGDQSVDHIIGMLQNPLPNPTANA